MLVPLFIEPKAYTVLADVHPVGIEYLCHPVAIEGVVPIIVQYRREQALPVVIAPLTATLPLTSNAYVLFVTWLFPTANVPAMTLLVPDA